MSAVRTFLGASIVLAIGCGGSSSDVGEGGAGSGSTSEGDGSAAGNASDSSMGGSTPPGTVDDGSAPVGSDDGGAVTPPADDAGPGGGVRGRDAAAPGGGTTTPPRGTDGGPNQIACGGKACDSTTEVCCVTRNAETCMAASMCRGNKLTCSGTNACATGVCCEGPGDAGRGVLESTCEDKCPRGSTQLCTTNADCTGANEICRAGACVVERVPPGPARDAGVPVGPMFDGGFPGFGDGGFRRGP